ncbi:MAG TPA: ATP-dependent DNA helicase RecG [Anaerolineales bacterium]|nr:ATP-dependent DNA helicase RecG [Anaerolineales bacterium]
MKASILKLKKFFRLEAERKYDNRSVFGGLYKGLQSWVAEARAEGLGEDLILVIGARLRGYEGQTPVERQKTLLELWRRIEGETGGAQNGKTSPPQKQAAKPSPATSRPARPAVEAAGKTPVKVAATIGTEPKPGRQKAAPRPRAEGSPAALNAPTTVLYGVGTVNAKRLENLGVHTLGDMLYHFPRRYEDYSQLTAISSLLYGRPVTIAGTIRSISNRPVKGKRTITEIIVEDGSGALRVTWFNQPWMARNLHVDNEVVLAGQVEQFQGRLTLNNPEWDLLDKEQLHTNRIVPVYPLAAHLGQRWLRGLMKRVVTYWAPRVPDPLPPPLVSSAQVVPLAEALLHAHFPESMEKLRAARQRLAFEELLLMQLAVLTQKQLWQGKAARRFDAPEPWLAEQIARLPFALTGAQQTALADVLQDMDSGKPMNRLLEGDVGSGKTVVAALCMAAVAQHGAQAAMMAPTSILAEQHYATLSKLLVGKAGLQAGELRLIVGSTPEAEKEEIRRGLHQGSIKAVVGTHTLIEDPILFAELEMIVIDEQHRFGVGQRAALRGKGTNPHLLVMTATPIPRSLALTLYGDLDLSVIDEMPPGRRDVNTQLLLPRERQRAYQLIRNEVEGGHQAFIIYPFIESEEDGDGENGQRTAAVEEEKRLKKEVFPDLKLRLLHGRMPAEDKERAMAAFRDGKAQVLVSTTVIEVGVDIPNASVMLIEGANHFGLAQLHQLRGRVGRGADQSYCILIPDRDQAAENERLQALLETNDGFMLAEKDLQQRGPGQFIGRQQSGFLDFRLASLSDGRLIDKARRHAEELLAADPALSKPEHQPLAAVLKIYLSDGKGDPS